MKVGLKVEAQVGCEMKHSHLRDVFLKMMRFVQPCMYHVGAFSNARSLLPRFKLTVRSTSHLKPKGCNLLGSDDEFSQSDVEQT